MLPVKTTMGKAIGLIYKYSQRKWAYPYPNTTFVIPPLFDASIQTQHNSASDASVNENDVASDGLYQSTIHHGNKDGKDNNDSQSYEAPQKHNFHYSSSGNTIATTTTP